MSYRRSLLRRLLLAAALVLLISLVMATPALAQGTGGWGLNPLLPDASSPNGKTLHELYNLISLPALVVFFLIEGLLLFIIVRYRRRALPPGYRPPQWHGNTVLEVVWTIIPALLMVWIGWLSFTVLQRDFAQPAAATSPNELNIAIEAHQFGWKYTYPDGVTVTSEAQQAAQNPMVIPTGRVVRLRLTSIDVIHSWWVPGLMGKTDTVPGYDNYTWIRVDKPGQWRGQCAELCGVGHYTMELRVKAVSPDEYEDWVAEQKSKTARPSPSPAKSPSPGASPSQTGTVRPSPSPS